MKKILFLSVLAILLSFTPAMARQGPYVGVGLTYVNITSMADPYFDTVDPALGYEFRFGYNFGPMAIEGNFIGSTHHDSFPGFSDGDFWGWSLDFRFFLLPEPNQLYLLLGVGGYEFSQNDNFTGEHFDLTGPGFNLGMGFEHYFNPQVSIDVRGVYRFINYDEEINGFTVDTNVNGDTFTLGAAVNFHF